MKSPQVENISPEEEGQYSELKVLQSAAGYYVGTIYTGIDGFVEPGSRDSDYFATEREAEKFLKEIENESPEAFNQLRMWP